MIIWTFEGSTYFRSSKLSIQFVLNTKTYTNHLCTNINSVNNVLRLFHSFILLNNRFRFQSILLKSLNLLCFVSVRASECNFASQKRLTTIVIIVNKIFSLGFDFVAMLNAILSSDVLKNYFAYHGS